MAILSSLLAMSMVSTGAPGVFAYTVGDGGNDPVHEYTVERAMALYQATQTNSEMSDYLGTIQDGTEHEDLHDHVTDRTGIFNLFLIIDTKYPLCF